MPTPIVSAYSTTKWAIIGFSLGLRVEASELGVNVSVACPGLVQTSISDRNAYWNVNKEELKTVFLPARQPRARG